MKNRNWVKKVLATVLAMGLLLASCAALADSGVNLVAPKAKDVVIDGDISEWDTSKFIKISTEAQITDQIEHWDGEDDCSAELYAMWDEDNLYLALSILDDTPFVYREGFPLDELDAVIFFLSTNPESDPARTAYEATDWRIVTSVEDYYKDWFNFVDRDMIDDPMGYETQGEYGDEQVFENYEAAFTRTKTGAIYEIRLGWDELSSKQLAKLTPAAAMTVGFDFSILDVDLPCPGIHSLRMQCSANLTGRDRTPAAYDVDHNPSLWGTLTFAE